MDIHKVHSGIHGALDWLDRYVPNTCEYIFLKGDPLNKILTNVSFFLSKVGGVSVHPICRFLSLLPSILPGVSLLLKRFPKIELVTISVFSEITCWLLRGAYKGSGLQ